MINELDAERVLSQGLTLRVVGQFNPAIFHPSWLARHDLISVASADAASVEVVHSAISRFSLDWVESATTNSEWNLDSEDPGSYERVRDLAVGAVTTLPETPLEGLVLSNWWHIASQSTEVAEDKLATAIVEGALLQTMSQPRLYSLLLEGTSAIDLIDELALIVEPSRKYAGAYFVQVHQRFQREEDSLRSIRQFLLDSWWEAHDERRSLAAAVTSRLDEALK